MNTSEKSLARRKDPTGADKIILILFIINKANFILWINYFQKIITRF